MNLPGIGDPRTLVAAIAAQGLIHFPVAPLAGPAPAPVFNVTNEAGEIPLKEWIDQEAARTGRKRHAIEMRLDRGKYPHLKLRREGHGKVFVKP